MDSKTLRLKIAAVPSPVKSWFGSEDITLLIKGLNAHFNISGENQHVIPRLLLRLEINDLDAEYFSGELAAELKMDKDRAVAITAEIKKSILIPIKKDLADYGIDLSLLDKFETPPIVKLPSDGPKIIQDIGPAISTTKGPAVVVPISPAPATAAPATTMPPAKFPEVGWSKTTPEQPMVKLSQSLPSAPPTPVSLPATPVSPANRIMSAPMAKPIMPLMTGPVGEFERLGAQKGQGSAPPSAAPSAAPVVKPAAPEPAPIIIHEDAVFKPQQASPDFRFQTPNEKIDMQKSAAGPAPVRAAVLELGKAAPVPNAAPAGAMPRVVHYSEYQPSAGRRVTELTSPPPAPKPSPVTAPPPPPKPPIKPSAPSPSTPPQNKVIYKDYSAEPQPTKPIVPPAPTPPPPAPLKH